MSLTKVVNHDSVVLKNVHSGSTFKLASSYIINFQRCLQRGARCGIEVGKTNMNIKYNSNLHQIDMVFKKTIQITNIPTSILSENVIYQLKFTQVVVKSGKNSYSILTQNSKEMPKLIKLSRFEVIQTKWLLYVKKLSRFTFSFHQSILRKS